MAWQTAYQPVSGASFAPRTYDLDGFKLYIGLLNNLAHEFTDKSAIHALADDHEIIFPSPHDFREHLHELEEQNCAEFHQANTIVGTLASPDRERIYHPFWDAIPFYIDGVGIYPELCSILALEDRLLQDVYKAWYPSSFDDDIEPQVKWFKLLVFGILVSLETNGAETERRYLHVKAKRIEVQKTIWRDRRVSGEAGRVLKVLWKWAYPGHASWPGMLDSLWMNHKFHKTAGALSFGPPTPTAGTGNFAAAGPMVLVQGHHLHDQDDYNMVEADQDMEILATQLAECEIRAKSSEEKAQSSEEKAEGLSVTIGMMSEEAEQMMGIIVDLEHKVAKLEKEAAELKRDKEFYEGLGDAQGEHVVGLSGEKMLLERELKTANIKLRASGGVGALGSGQMLIKEELRWIR